MEIVTAAYLFVIDLNAIRYTVQYVGATAIYSAVFFSGSRYGCLAEYRNIPLASLRLVDDKGFVATFGVIFQCGTLAESDLFAIGAEREIEIILTGNTLQRDDGLFAFLGYIDEEVVVLAVADAGIIGVVVLCSLVHQTGFSGFELTFDGRQAVAVHRIANHGRHQFHTLSLFDSLGM